VSEVGINDDEKNIIYYKISYANVSGNKVDIAASISKNTFNVAV
jgi:hypothetical protein